MSLPVSTARFVAHRLREAALYPRMLGAPRGRRILVLQSMGRQMSGLLRGYEIADQLNRRGWRCLVVPKQLDLAQRKRVLRRFAPDMVLLLKSRDPDSSHELLRGYPYLYDVDDADFLDPRLTERMIADVRNAAGVMAGSRYVAEWCRQYNPDTRVVWTGSKPQMTGWTDHSSRKPIVTWAQSAPTRYPAEFDFVLSVMDRVAVPPGGMTLRLYGGDGSDDGGRSAHLRGLGIDVQWMPYMKYDAFIRSLDEVAVGLSPICVQSDFSRGKSFGKILAYLDAKVPVIASDEADHAVFFTQGSGIVSNDPETWAREIEALLAAPEKRQAMAERAHDRFMECLTLEVAADQVESFVTEVLDRARAHP